MTYQYQSINELPLSVLPKAAAEFLNKTRLYSFERIYSKSLMVIILLGVLALWGMLALSEPWRSLCILLLILFSLIGGWVIERNIVKSIDPECNFSYLDIWRFSAELSLMKDQIRKETCQDILHQYGLSQLDPTQIPVLYSQYDELRQSMLSKWSAQLAKLTFSVKKERVIGLLSTVAALLLAVLQDHNSFDFLVDIASWQDALRPLAGLLLLFIVIWMIIFVIINSLFQLLFTLRDAVVKPGSLREHIHIFLSEWMWYGPKREPEGVEAERDD